VCFCLALTSQPASQSRCPGGSREQEERREQDQHHTARTHRDPAPVLVQDRGGGPSDLVLNAKVPDSCTFQLRCTLILSERRRFLRIQKGAQLGPRHRQISLRLLKHKQTNKMRPKTLYSALPLQVTALPEAKELHKAHTNARIRSWVRYLLRKSDTQRTRAHVVVVISAGYSSHNCASK